MAAKRSREKAAGFRRLNIAVRPEVLDRLAELMNQHNCPSQARVIELLVMADHTSSAAGSSEAERNEVTRVPSEKQLPSAQENPAPAKAPGKTGVVIIQDKTVPTQMGLFES